MKLTIYIEYDHHVCRYNFKKWLMGIKISVVTHSHGFNSQLRFHSWLNTFVVILPKMLHLKPYAHNIYLFY